AGVGDREAADRRIGPAVEPHFDEPAHARRRTGGDARAELVRGAAAEVDVRVLRPVTVGDEAHVLAAAGVGGRLQLRAALRAERLGLDRAVRPGPAGRRRWRRARGAAPGGVDREVVDQHRYA